MGDMQPVQWSDDSTGCHLNFQLIDFGKQVFVWASDGASFDSLDAAVPLKDGPSVSTLLFKEGCEQGHSLSGRLSACPPLSSCSPPL